MQQSNDFTPEISPAGDEKLVPVTEAIRYRRRAQAAEQQLEALHAQLEEAQTHRDELSAELSGVRRERELIEKLARAGAEDLETAALLASSRMGASRQPDADAVIAQLRKDKPHLFAAAAPVHPAPRTGGVRTARSDGQDLIAGRARQAAQSGSRADVHAYMRARRAFI